MKHLAKILMYVAVVGLMVSFSNPPRRQQPEFMMTESRWVDSVFNTLNDDERLGQLFMVAAYSNRDMRHVREIRELIQKYKIGGLIFMQGGPLREARLTNYYQTLSKTPLLLAMDAEWGLAMRLDSVAKYPKQMTLGAIRNDSLIYYMGRQIAVECQRLGLHINFAPVADINNNAKNPVIGMRSFGENRELVTRKALIYMKGLQDQHILACGKHFPGHGDTDSDSHKTLPTINQSWKRLDSLELYPFKHLFGEGLGSVMVAHLFIPALDTTSNRASTLSPLIVTDLLKKQLGFEGLIFTDALNMKGAGPNLLPGEVETKALIAGNDVLLFSENIGKAFEEIKKAIQSGQLSQEDINAHCKKILKAKYWCGLNHKQRVPTRHLMEEINAAPSYALNVKLAEASTTLLKNEQQTLPLKGLDSLHVAVLSVGEKERNTFADILGKYTKIDFYGIEHDAKPAEKDSILNLLKNYNLVIVQLNKTSFKVDNNFGVSQQSIDLISTVCQRQSSILTLFSNPYLISKLGPISGAKAILEMYEYSSFSQKAAADAIVGAIRVNGQLPVSVEGFPAGTGLELNQIIRMQYIQPEEMGIDRSRLSLIDSIARKGIKDKAYPGCQVLAIKDGKVFYQQNFGTYTYAAQSPAVNDESLYDLASLTKILSSSLALMRLQGEHKFDYHQTLGHYLPALKGSNKAHLHIEAILAHQAGLQAFLPFWTLTLDKQWNYKPGYYAKAYSPEFPIQVANQLYVKQGYADSLLQMITESKLGESGKYLYSDLGYFYMNRIIEQQSGQPQDVYVRNTFYAPMGLALTYRPLEHYPLEQIVPTENDTKFRKQLLQGYVHDPAAALMGGVGGHAGVFGRASDVGTIMQMLLNKGEYGGLRYLSPEVVSDYTACHFCPENRRALCFDKPDPDPKKESPVPTECSPESFGHSGFTGTYAWADPKNNLIVVFLSNRIYPNADENRLAKQNIRTKIHKALYDAVLTAHPLF